MKTKSNVRRLAISLMLAVSAAANAATTVASWQMPIAFPTGTGNVPSGTSYLPPNTPSAAGTPSAGDLAGNPSAILSAFHTLAAATYTSPAGNGSQYSFSSNNWSPGDYYEVGLPTTGYTSLIVSWDQARSSTGPTAFKLQMSTNGNSFTDLFSYSVLQSGGGGAPGTWSSTTYNALYTNTFALPVSADNQANLVLRFTNSETAASAATGSNRIDNISVTVVPEPSTFAMLGLGIGFGGLVRRRRSAT
ncbi:MAG: PEP-CTERM sorting domain-containing protein [Verrucomicrobiales bacterium]